ncbi:MAG: hypothetical protein HY830_16835, partial [Actinobacteria bacterium]|nr:hypothetical protein [Actinomycetota bacterium]
MTAGRGVLVARLAAAVAALVGLVLLVVGATRGGSDGAGDQVSAGTTRLDGVVAVTTRPDVLAEGASRIRLGASARTSGSTVFVGVARADDVTAWVGDLARVDVLGAGEEGTLDIARTGTTTTAPDPAEADIWAASASGQGAARLDWMPAPGPWSAVVVAGPTPGGLERVDVGWVRPAGGSSAPAFVATGLVLLVAGAVALLVLRRRGGSPDDEFYDDFSGYDDADDTGDTDDTDDRDGTGTPGGPGAGGSTSTGPDPDATTTIPRVHGRRRAGTPPWARVVPLALALSLGATACSSGSSGGTATATGSATAAGTTSGASAVPSYPAVLVPQAENVLDKV